MGWGVKRGVLSPLRYRLTPTPAPEGVVKAGPSRPLHVGTGWRRSPFLPQPCSQAPPPPPPTGPCLAGRAHAGLLAHPAFPRPSLCEYGDTCTQAHSDEELQEWTQRAQNLELRERAAWQEGLAPYQARLLAEYRHSSSEVLVVRGGHTAGRGCQGHGQGADSQASPCSWLGPSTACPSPAPSPWCIRPTRRKPSTAGCSTSALR